jgi:hypothetical protein
MCRYLSAYAAGTSVGAYGPSMHLRRDKIERLAPALLDVEFDYDENEGGENGFLTVSSPEALVQLEVLHADLRRLGDIPGTNWTERQTVQAGSCAGVPVHWHAGDRQTRPRSPSATTPRQRPLASS